MQLDVLILQQIQSVLDSERKVMPLYQVKQELRSYQRRALEIALSNPGCAIALPTGTGKTLVGCSWACELLNAGQAQRILVLEPSRFLVEQVEQYYQNKTNIPVVKVYGIYSQENRADIWKKPVPLVVATPQVAFNDLSLLNFDAVIVDECHHITGDYAYRKLLQAYHFKRRLGLSATIPIKLRLDVEQSIGHIYKWSWSDPEIEPFVPEWYGDIYDAELDDEERKVLERLEDIRNNAKVWLQAAMASLAIRMFARDGALALIESLERSENDTRRRPKAMSDLLMGHDLTPLLSRCRPLHKLDQLKAALAEHDFTKAIVFVDRVCIANELMKHFADLNPVRLLGRLHGGSEAQKLALEKAKGDDVRLVVSTSVGEEGIDLPEADLIISWSITASPIRFIQRKGRGMRPTPVAKDKVKVDVFIATPDTPDYDALYSGIDAAIKEGVQIVTDTERKELLKGTTLGRMQTCLESRAMTFNSLVELTHLPKNIVTKHTRHLAGEGRVLYIYDFDADEMLRRRVKWVSNFLKEIGNCLEEPKLDLEQWLDGRYRWEGLNHRDKLAMLLNFQMTTEDRLFIDANALSVLAETEYVRLFDVDDKIMLKVTYGFNSGKRAEHFARGNWHHLVASLKPVTEQRLVYLMFSYSGSAAVSISYHGRFSEQSLPLIVRNACWISRQAENLAQQIRNRFKP